MKTPTEKAEEYLRDTVEGWDDIPAIPKYDTDVYLAGHTEGRREALEMAQGLVRALQHECCCPGERHYLPPYDLIKCDACESIAKFEAWREGK